MHPSFTDSPWIKSFCTSAKSNVDQNIWVLPTNQYFVEILIRAVSFLCWEIFLKAQLLNDFLNVWYLKMSVFKQIFSQGQSARNPCWSGIFLLGYSQNYHCSHSNLFFDEQWSRVAGVCIDKSDPMVFDRYSFMSRRKH